MVDNGWINSIALIGQIEVDINAQIRRQVQYGDDLIILYQEEIAEKHGLTIEQLKEIEIEGLVKDWPCPILSEVDQAQRKAPVIRPKQIGQLPEVQRIPKGYTVVAAESKRGVTAISVVLKGKYKKSEIMELSRKLKSTYALFKKGFIYPESVKKSIAREV